MAEEVKRGLLKKFWDFFVLFSGVSTSSNLSRTQGRQVRNRGLFLFRNPPEEKEAVHPKPTDPPR
jgi:hypothetical protein